MANPPPPYSDITGISRSVMKDNAQETVLGYDGHARPGELTMDLTTDPPTIYIGNNLGNLTMLTFGGSGNGVPGGPTNSIQINNGSGGFAGYSNFTFNGTNAVTVVGNVNSTNVYASTNVVAAGNVTASYGIFSGGNTVINSTISTTGNIIGGNITTAGLVSVAGNVTADYYIGNGSQLTGITGSQLTGVITTILPNALSSTVHIAANTVGNTATIITDATTANTANTIVVRDQYGAINVNAWAVNTYLTAVDYTATSTDYWIGCSAKTITITLPNAANGAYNGRQYQIADVVHSGNPNDVIAAQSPATVTGNPFISQQGQIVTATYINGVWYCN